MVEHHLGQQQQGEEPEGAAESTGTQETCPPGITDTEAESRMGTSGKAQSTFRLGREQPSSRQALPFMGQGLATARNCPENMDVYACIAYVCISSPFLTESHQPLPTWTSELPVLCQQPSSPPQGQQNSKAKMPAPSLSQTTGHEHLT